MMISQPSVVNSEFNEDEDDDGKKTNKTRSDRIFHSFWLNNLPRQDHQVNVTGALAAVAAAVADGIIVGIKYRIFAQFSCFSSFTPCNTTPAAAAAVLELFILHTRLPVLRRHNVFITVHTFLKITTKTTNWGRRRKVQKSETRGEKSAQHRQWIALCSYRNRASTGIFE